MRRASSSCASRLEDVGHLPHRHRPLAHVAQALVDGQLLLPGECAAPRPARLAPGGCPPPSPSSPPAPARRPAARRRATPPPCECAAPRPARLAPARMSATFPIVTARDAHVAQPLVDGQLLLPANPQRLVQLASRLRGCPHALPPPAQPPRSAWRLWSNVFFSRAAESARSSAPHRMATLASVQRKFERCSGLSGVLRTRSQ